MPRTRTTTATLDAALTLGALAAEPLSPRDAAAQRWSIGYARRNKTRFNSITFTGVLYAYLRARDFVHPNERDGKINLNRCIALAGGAVCVHQQRLRKLAHAS